MKRSFDLLGSVLGILALLPLLIIISFLVYISSKGRVFYIQRRVGKGNREFNLYKFRTMYDNSDKKGLLTVGEKDNRVTKLGFYLRKYKLDELPQLVNVVLGDMSFVGPRPEIRKYVDMYNEQQKSILNVRPGITDPASITFRNESELLARVSNPEEYYIHTLLPQKIELNLLYLSKQSFLYDVYLIFKTVKALFVYK